MTEKNSFEKAAQKEKKVVGFKDATRRLTVDIIGELKKRNAPVHTDN